MSSLYINTRIYKISSYIPSNPHNFLVISYKMRNPKIVLVLVLSLLLCFQMGKGSCRLLHDEAKTLGKKGISVNSLQRGPVPPSGPSGCTHIPGSGGIGCPIDEMHFAGGAQPRRGGGSAASPPSILISFGAATLAK